MSKSDSHTPTKHRGPARKKSPVPAALQLEYSRLIEAREVPAGVHFTVSNPGALVELAYGGAAREYLRVIDYTERTPRACFFKRS